MRIRKTELNFFKYEKGRASYLRENETKEEVMTHKKKPIS